MKRQCELIGQNRTSVYYVPVQPTAEALAHEELIKSRLDFWHTKQCCLGTRGLKTKLRKEDGLLCGRKLITRYMAEMGIYAVYPKPNLSRNKKHKAFPYLLRNLSIFLPNQVWAIDITYIKMGKSHMYLTAVIDWYSRFIVGWTLSDTLDTAPVIDALSKAIVTYGVPAIVNSDQGCQFTSEAYSSFLRNNRIRQSMDGKARWVDNVIIERWFRTLKCENIYINEYNSPKELRHGIRDFIQQYNTDRPHTEHGGDYPCEVYIGHFAA